MMGLTEIQRRNDATRTIRCAACDGSGRAPIGPAYLVTLDAITAEWQLTARIHRKLGGARVVKLTALANRLAFLAKHGFVERRPSATNFRCLEWRRA